MMRGFSLIEMLIVLAILSIITAAVFQVVNLATERSSTEQTKLDMFQEAREFMDQMSRDLRQAGYPSPRNVAPSVITQIPAKNDRNAAVGLVQVADGDLWFEGDVDGTGTVSAVRYHLESTGLNCPCLKRSQHAKIHGDPLEGQTTPQYQVEVQGVQNTNIFSAYSNNATVGLPVTTSTASGATIANIDTIQAILTLEGAVVDPRTRRKPVTTLITTVKLNNCSQASSSGLLSC
jgi:prepilin-type N-terminal cleavage/methylation domain-containing protein